VDAHAPDQLVACINRHDIAVDVVAAPVDQQGFYVGLQIMQQRVVGDDLLPRIDGQQRFGRARGAGIKGQRLVGGGAVEEERHSDRYLHRLPLSIGDLESGVVHVTVRHGPEMAASRALGREEEIAPAARAHQASLFDVDDVRVLFGNRLSAHLTSLARHLPGRAICDEPLQAARKRGLDARHDQLTSGITISRAPLDSRSGIGSRCTV
jgi:hypothetical protein